jgi:hypothetical protein
MDFSSANHPSSRFMMDKEVSPASFARGVDVQSSYSGSGPHI